MTIKTTIPFSSLIRNFQRHASHLNHIIHPNTGQYNNNRSNHQLPHGYVPQHHISHQYALSSPPTLQPSTHTLFPPPQGNSYNFPSTTNISSTTQSHCLTCNFQLIYTYFSAITCIATSITTSMNPSHQHNHQFHPNLVQFVPNSSQSDVL